MIFCLVVYKHFLRASCPNDHLACVYCLADKLLKEVKHICIIRSFKCLIIFILRLIKGFQRSVKEVSRLPQNVSGGLKQFLEPADYKKNERQTSSHRTSELRIFYHLQILRTPESPRSLSNASGTLYLQGFEENGFHGDSKKYLRKILRGRGKQE